MGRDSGIGFGLLALCGILYWQATGIPTPPFVPIGPGFYPRIILILLAGLAVWLIVEDVIAAPGRPGAATGRAGPGPDYRSVVCCFAIFGGYVIGLSLIGYLAATFLFVLLLGWVLGPRQARELPKLAAIAAGTCLVTYLIFEKYLHVFLPRGRLF
jgi:hypothetical protein